METKILNGLGKGLDTLSEGCVNWWFSSIVGLMQLLSEDVPKYPS